MGGEDAHPRAVSSTDQLDPRLISSWPWPHDFVVNPLSIRRLGLEVGHAAALPFALHGIDGKTGHTCFPLPPTPLRAALGVREKVNEKVHEKVVL